MQQQQQQQQSTPPMATKKSVRFSPIDEVRTTISIYDMDQQEIASSWFTDEEYTAIANKCRKIIKHMERGHGKSYCTRGLEKMVGERQSLLSMNRELAYDAVMNEQYEQMTDGVSYPHRIAHLYNNVSAPCQRQAYRMAMADEIIIEKYVAVERTILAKFPTRKAQLTTATTATTTIKTILKKEKNGDQQQQQQTLSCRTKQYAHSRGPYRASPLSPRLRKDENAARTA